MEAKTERTERRNRQIHLYSWRLRQHPSIGDRSSKQKITKNSTGISHLVNLRKFTEREALRAAKSGSKGAPQAWRETLLSLRLGACGQLHLIGGHA